MDVFDLIKTPEQIAPELALDLLFLGIGPALLTLAIVVLQKTTRGSSITVDRYRRQMWFLIPFSLCFTAVTSLMCTHDILHAYDVRGIVKQGRYTTLEGCLQYFRAGRPGAGKNAAGSERWVVNSREFSYRDSQVRFAYHTVESKGGIVHADSWVRVSFVPDTFLGSDDIVRLESKSHLCPPAPDIR